jgi:endonuclease/exonuclease/phosphatase family metal-dependent hydrolase
MYRDLFSSAPCVLMGDLNSSVKYASMCPSNCHHLTLVGLLTSLGLVSAYHSFFREEQGQESRPTLYFQWNEFKPFHIDYCFLPGSWVKQIVQVAVGGFDDWKGMSDHRPLTIDIDFNIESAADPKADGAVPVR